MHLKWFQNEDLCYPLGTLFAKLCWRVKVLHQVGQKTKHVQRESWGTDRKKITVKILFHRYLKVTVVRVLYNDNG